MSSDTPTSGAVPAGNAENLRIAGWLLPAPEDRIRILLQDADMCLEFHVDSIEAISPRQSEQDSSEQPMAVGVELRRGAALLQIGPGAPWRSMFQMYPRPFALSVRQAKPEMIGHLDYLAREAAYFALHGLAHTRSELV